MNGSYAPGDPPFRYFTVLSGGVGEDVAPAGEG